MFREFFYLLMRKLERWLTNNSQRIEEAVTSNSKYFNIKGITIRYSDHYSTSSDGSLQIIYSYEDCEYYSVFMKGSVKILIWKAKQIIEFLPHFILIKNMEKGITKDVAIKVVKDETEDTTKIVSVNNNVRIQSNLSVNNLKGDLKFVYTRQAKAWSKAEIRDAGTLLKKEFNNNAEYFNAAFKKFLANHSLTYIDLINLYNQVVIIDKVIPNGTVLEDYYHKMFT